MSFIADTFNDKPKLNKHQLFAKLNKVFGERLMTQTPTENQLRQIIDKISSQLLDQSSLISTKVKSPIVLAPMELDDENDL